MAIIQNSFHSLKHDNRLFYAMMAGWAVGGLVNLFAARRIDILRHSKGIESYNQTQTFFSSVGWLGAFLAYRYKSTKLAGVSALGFSGGFWYLYQIRMINSQTYSGDKQKHIDRAVKISFAGLIGMIAVPVSVFACNAAQSMKKV